MKTLNSAMTVRQLNLYVKSLLEGDHRLMGVTVTGEISNFKMHYASGHWYFTLKDSAAALKCVMFRAAASKVAFTPEDGMLVTLFGRVSIYERDGIYQFYAEEMHTSGNGDIALAFKQTHKKLDAEGLFDPTTKRKLIKYPKRIAVITSDTGAAVKDILNILERRFPICEIVLCPVTVQGEFAATDMIKTLDRVYALSNIDCIIIGRGGGSAEDLSAFNSEALAYKIYESNVPIISAVGHETDFSISDFVADLRAPTPSAAAELAVPDSKELIDKINNIKGILLKQLQSNYIVADSKYKLISGSTVLRCPFDTLSARQQTLDSFTQNLHDSAYNHLQKRFLHLEKLFMKLEPLNPIATLSRGFAAVHKDGRLVKSVLNISPDDKIQLEFKDGVAECSVNNIISDNKEQIYDL